MHAAKTRLPELVRAVEVRGNTVILCRAGKQVAEIRPCSSRRHTKRILTPDPRLAVSILRDNAPRETCPAHLHEAGSLLPPRRAEFDTAGFLAGLPRRAAPKTRKIGAHSITSDRTIPAYPGIRTFGDVQ